MLILFKKVLLVPSVKCGWCGKEIPIVTTRPKKCPFCGMAL